MMRMMMVALLSILILNGCSAKEFNAGVNDAADGVTRVIRGTNN